MLIQIINFAWHVSVQVQPGKILISNDSDVHSINMQMRRNSNSQLKVSSWKDTPIILHTQKELSSMTIKKFELQKRQMISKKIVSMSKPRDRANNISHDKN
jgi:hypothetical protein